MEFLDALDFYNGRSRLYVNCRQLRLFIPLSSIGRAVHPVGGEGIRQKRYGGFHYFSQLIG